MEYDLLAYDIYAGFGVGKFSHHVVAIKTNDQRIILSEKIAQEEEVIRGVLKKLKEFGRVLAVVDQKGSIGRLLVATIKDMGIDAGFLTPSDFHSFAKGYTEIKSDAKDAYIIADIAMRFTNRISPIADFEEKAEALRTLTSFREMLVRDNTQAKNRIRNLLVQIHPVFEACIKKEHLEKPAYLHIFKQYGGPYGIRRAGKKRLKAFISKLPYYGKKADSIVEHIFCALSQQTVHLPGAGAREEAIKSLAAALILREREIKEVEEKIKTSYKNFPESIILNSIPGIGNVFGAVILAEVGDISQYKDAGHLAAYGGVAPSKRQSGTTLNRGRKKVKCNRQLRNAFCESAWISVRCDDWSAWFYEKKRTEGKKHRQAILALARHRTDIIYAMLKTGSLYEPKTMTR